MAKALSRGFLTLELLISITIMTVMSSVVLSANSQISSRLRVDNLAHQIALSIREAQVKALSALADDDGTFPGYGLYFATAGTPANQTQFANFSDEMETATLDAEDQVYSAGEETGVRTLGLGMTINSLQTNTGAGGAMQSASSISIVFRRPRQDALIRMNGATPATRAEIVVRSPTGALKTITVTSVGQISVR